MEPPYDLGRLRLSRDLVFLDTETTGTDLTLDRVIQIGLIRLSPDGRTVEYDTLINPGIPVPIEAQRIHGINDEMLQFAPPFKRLVPELLQKMEGADLAGFNLLRFDIPILRSEFQRTGHIWDLEGVKILDSQVIFHKMEPRDLSAAYQFYCGRKHEDAHGALADTRVSLEVLLAQVRRYGDLPDEVGPLDALFHQIDRRFLDSGRKFMWRNGEAVFNFGNRRGQALREVASKNPDYLEWMLDRDFPADVRALVRDALAGRFPTPPDAESTAESNVEGSPSA